MKEADIIHENEGHWVWREARKGYHAMRHKGLVSETDSTYSLDEDGKSLAIARVDYLAKRFPLDRRAVSQ